MATITSSGNTGATVGGVLDTALDEFAPTTNFNTDTQCYIDTWNTNKIITMLLIFPIPSGSGTVSNSKLRLYLTEKGGPQTALSVYEILRTDVSVTQATANIYKTSNNWTTSCAQGSGTDRSASAVATGTVSGVATGNYIELTGSGLTALIQNAVTNGLTNVYLNVQFTNVFAYDASYVRFRTTEGTNGQRPALVYDLASTTIFDMTAASQEWTPNAVQNKRTVTTTAASQEWTPNAIQNKRTAVMTAASQEWTPNAIQNRLTATMTAASLNWSAKVIDFVSSAGVVVFDMTAAAFEWTTNAVQNKLTATMTSPALEWTTNAIQNLRRVTLTAPVVSWSAKTIQNLYRATLSAAQIRLTAQAFSARLLVTLTSVTNGSWSAKALQMLQRVSLTRATLNFQPLAFDFISDAIVEVVRKIWSRLSHYRKLLKQRRY